MRRSLVGSAGKKGPGGGCPLPVAGVQGVSPPENFLELKCP